MMANSNKLFIKFNDELKLTQSKKDNLITSRDEVREKIRAHFKKEHPKHVPNFWIQGSYKTKTIIRYQDDTCDLDDGVYFFRQPDVSSETLQSWILDAVDDITVTPSEHKTNCIRVIYKNDYHIDLPVYYKSNNDEEEHPKLAIKYKGFKKSDPEDFWKWFTEQKKAEEQLVRVVKYLKSWVDNIGSQMPNGLAMTLLACECLEANDRDDIALRGTLKTIMERLDKNWELKMPTCPKDDLFADYDYDRKVYFLTELDKFIKDANKAIEEKYLSNAATLWKKYLGTHFPEVKDEDDKKEKALRNKASILSGTPFIDRKGNITKKDTGKPIPDTENYGGGKHA